MTNPNLPPGMSYGSEKGLKHAQNAGQYGRLAGRAAGVLTGIPLSGMLGQQIGNYMGNQYMQSHVFQNPVAQDSSGWLDDYLYGSDAQRSPVYVTPEAQAAAKRNVAMRDQANRATDRGNTAYTGLWGPGTGSRMNRNSAFIYGMGLPGQNNAQYEPQRRTRLSGDK